VDFISCLYVILLQEDAEGSDGFRETAAAATSADRPSDGEHLTDFLNSSDKKSLLWSPRKLTLQAAVPRRAPTKPGRTANGLAEERQKAIERGELVPVQQGSSIYFNLGLVTQPDVPPLFSFVGFVVSSTIVNRDHDEASESPSPGLSINSPISGAPKIDMAAVMAQRGALKKTFPAAPTFPKEAEQSPPTK
jgi:hypothetical protein